MSDQKTAFPLCWPEGWPRIPKVNRRPSYFRRAEKYGRPEHSMEEVCRALSTELQRLGAGESGILSANVRRRIDGQPYSGQAQPDDTGAAVYFKIKGRQVSLACDKWNRVEDNIWAIVKHIEALRGQERWGVGSMEQAFRGYMALPAIGQTSGLKWWEVLGVPINASAAHVKEAFRILAKKHHPDAGGDAELFRRITEAYNQASWLLHKA